MADSQEPTPVRRGVGPSLLGQLTRDRGLRFALALAVAVAVPVAILFYFRFQSLSNLQRASTVVMQQLSESAADDLAKHVEQELKRPHLEVLLRSQYQTEPLNLPYVKTVFTNGLEKIPVRRRVLRLVDSRPVADRRGHCRRARARSGAPRRLPGGAAGEGARRAVHPGEDAGAGDAPPDHRAVEGGARRPADLARVPAALQCEGSGPAVELRRPARRCRAPAPRVLSGSDAPGDQGHRRARRLPAARGHAARSAEPRHLQLQRPGADPVRRPAGVPGGLLRQGDPAGRAGVRADGDHLAHRHRVPGTGRSAPSRTPRRRRRSV